MSNLFLGILFICLSIAFFYMLCKDINNEKISFMINFRAFAGVIAFLLLGIHFLCKFFS